MATIRQNENIRYELEGNIDDVIKTLQRYAKEYLGRNPSISIDIESGYYGDGPSVEANLVYDREETLEEITTREKKEKRWAEQREADDRASYLRLKKKFDHD